MIREWVEEQARGPLPENSMWWQARHHVEVASLGIEHIWTQHYPNECNADTFANRYFADGLFGRVTIQRQPHEVAANYRPLERHQCILRAKLYIKLLAIMHYGMAGRHKHPWMHVLVFNFLF